MHKKIEGELVSLAHSILQMKNRDNVYALHEKAAKIYEQLSVLKFVEDYIGTTPDLKESKEEILAKVIDANDRLERELETSSNEGDESNSTPSEPVASEVGAAEEVKTEPEVVTQIEEQAPDQMVEAVADEPAPEKPQISEETAAKMFGTQQEMTKNDPRDAGPVQLTLDEEIKEAISADLATSMFETATKETPVFVKPETLKKRSLNDAAQSSNLQIGLNDRIAFVKYLFDDSQEDFNRVVSQLNSFNSELEAKDFVENFVKPDYNWEGKEAYEERLIALIERRFA